jgi:multicomponent K+:H+ antiporter subunit E
MVARLVPHPILTLLITGVWILLANDFSLGTLVFGLILGVAVPRLTSAYWPDRPHIRLSPAIVEYGLVVLWDIIIANVEVSYLILFRRSDHLRSLFVTVPLDLRTPEAITTLAGTITMTPGTVSADVSADGRALLVHCLDTGDPAATIARIKTRYERRLKRIFE